MQNNQDNKDEKERSEQQANIEASEKMSRNGEEQNEVYRSRQNEVTKPKEAESANSLSNHEQTNDSVPMNDKNKRRLEMDEDSDFGNEQLQ